MKDKIAEFNQLRKIRDAFKKVTQLSYNLSQIDKKFPIETLDTDSYDNLLKVYTDFFNELEDAKNSILIALEEQNKKNEIQNNQN